MRKHEEAGFTLIELLIVIAIIAILVSLILVAVFAGRDKARDNSIRTSVGQIRWLAEYAYDNNAASYVRWKDDPEIQADLTTLLDEIDSKYGDTDPAQYVSKLRDTQRKDYCVSAPLVAEAGKYYCIDATGVFTTVSQECPEDPAVGPDGEGDGNPVLRCPAS